MTLHNGTCTQFITEVCTVSKENENIINDPKYREGCIKLPLIRNHDDDNIYLSK